MRSTRALIGLTALFASLAPDLAFAQDVEPASATTRFIFDSMLILAGGFGALVACLGLAMRDVGAVQVQNAPLVSLRAMGGYAVAALMFWLLGYQLAFGVEAGGLLGEFAVWRNEDVDPIAAGSSVGAKWYFYMSMAAMGVLAVSGATAGRVRFLPFLLFAAVFAGLIFPIAVSWSWGGGYLSDAWQYADYGGAGVLHVAAGAAALAAVMVIGPRPAADGDTEAAAAATATLPMTLLGALVFWIGMALVVAARQGHLSSTEDMISIATVTINITLAGAGGLLASLILTQTIYKKPNLITVAAGAIGGMVSLTGDPLFPALWQAVMIGAAGGVIVTVAPAFLDRFRLDDATNAIAAHLFCGGWSLVMVAWTNPDAWLIGQIIAAAAIASFSFVVSLLIWVALKYTIGVRRAPPEHDLAIG